MKNLFLIIGAPGSGKTTDAQQIAQNDKDIAHFSTGELLRYEVASGSELGKLIETRMNKGELVPVEVALNTIVKAIKNSTCNTILIDGYPRSFEQMIGLDTILVHEKYIKLVSVIEIVVSYETAKNRVLGRARGSDDNIKVFENRMGIYNKPLKNIQKFYNVKNILHKISGEKDINSVVQDMSNFIKNKLA